MLQIPAVWMKLLLSFETTLQKEPHLVAVESYYVLSHSLLGLCISEFV